MRNKLIFLFIVIVILISLMVLITINRKAKEKLKIEEKIRVEHQQFVKDSLRIIQESIFNSNNNTPNSNYSKENSNITEENFNSYINTSFTNTSINDIAVTITDGAGNISSSLSNSIALIYSQNGYNGKSGLIRSNFTGKNSYKDLTEGNSDIIEKMKLISYTDYLALGKIYFTFSKGTLVDGTFVCTASLSMNIVSTKQKSLIKSFSCKVNGNGVTEEQAKEYAINKLLSKFKSDYSSI